MWSGKMRNKRYEKTEKNKGIIPALTGADIRLEKCDIPCGLCPECRRQKKNWWEARLIEEFKERPYGQFVTLTIAPEWEKELEQLTLDRFKRMELDREEGAEKDSTEIAITCIHLFTDRWRKEYGKAPRRWLITELGHKGTYYDGLGKLRHKTERLHLHGLLFEKKDKFGKLVWVNEHNKKLGRKSAILDKLWKYGKCNVGYSEINEKVIGYCLKYVLKVDEEHEGFYGRILPSRGIGRNYVERNRERHQYKGEETNTKYTRPNGSICSLPPYWKNKLFTDKEREELRIKQMDKEVEIVNGKEIENYKFNDIIQGKRQAARQTSTLKLWGKPKKRYNYVSGLEEETEDRISAAVIAFHNMKNMPIGREFEDDMADMPEDWILEAMYEYDARTASIARDEKTLAQNFWEKGRPKNFSRRRRKQKKNIVVSNRATVDLFSGDAKGGKVYRVEK